MPNEKEYSITLHKNDDEQYVKVTVKDDAKLTAFINDRITPTKDEKSFNENIQELIVEYIGIETTERMVKNISKNH